MQFLPAKNSGETRRNQERKSEMTETPNNEVAEQVLCDGCVAVPLKNAGIALVTPAHYIRDLIESDPVREERQKYRNQDQLQPVATFDVVKFDRPAEAN